MLASTGISACNRDRISKISMLAKNNIISRSISGGLLSLFCASNNFPSEAAISLGIPRNNASCHFGNCNACCRNPTVALTGKLSSDQWLNCQIPRHSPRLHIPIYNIFLRKFIFCVRWRKRLVTMISSC